MLRQNEKVTSSESPCPGLRSPEHAASSVTRLSRFIGGRGSLEQNTFHLERPLLVFFFSSQQGEITAKPVCSAVSPNLVVCLVETAHPQPSRLILMTAANSLWVSLGFSGFLASLSAVFIGQVVWEVQLAPPPPRWIVPISKIEQGILGGKRGAGSDTEARLKKESPLKTICKTRLLWHPGGA